jgi:hypothetical protein
MPRQYGSPKRTQAGKRAAAIQMIVMSAKSRPEILAMLTGPSYGFREEEARAMMEEARRAAAKVGVRL